jgi:parallel beta-helix repeat protein
VTESTSDRRRRAAWNATTSNVKVLNSVFDGINNDNRNAISIIDGDGVTIEGSTFVNTTRANMPGAIDFEPDAQANAVIRNAVIRNNTFINIGGNVAVVALHIQPVVRATVRNITVENNTATGGTNNFFSFNAQKSPTAASQSNNIRIINNVASGSTRAAIVLPNGKGIQIRGNKFAHTDNSTVFGYTGATDTVRDVDVSGNTFTRLGKVAGSGIGIFKANNLRFAHNKFIDLGAGVGGSANAFDFNTGTSTGVQFERNVFSSPTGKTLIAIQKERGHTFTPSGNRFIGNEMPGALANAFVAGETDVPEAPRK